MKFTILVDPSLVIFTIYSDCLTQAKELIRIFLMYNIHFTHFTPKLSPLLVGGRGISFNLLYRAYIPNLV